MKANLYGSVIVLFIMVASWGTSNMIRAKKYRGELARAEAKSLTLEEKAHEADLLKESNDVLAAKIRAMTPSKTHPEAPGSPVAGAVALAKGQPAPFEGILADKNWVAKSLACLDYKDKWESTLGHTILREKKLEDSVATLRSSRNFWRNTVLIVTLAGGAYIYFRK